MMASNNSVVVDERGRQIVQKKKLDQHNDGLSFGPIVMRIGERLEMIEDEFEMFEDKVLKQLDAQKQSNLELERRIVQLEKMNEALEAKMEGMREELALCKNEMFRPSRMIDYPKPQSFKGARDGMEVENYLWRMEHYFGGVGLTDEAVKVKTATLYLTDIALLWWRRKHGGDSCQINMWEDFYPENEAFEARTRLRKLKQGGPLREYVKKFSSIMLQIPGMSEVYLIYSFIHGLQGWLKEELLRRKFNTVDEAIAFAECLSRFN